MDVSFARSQFPSLASTDWVLMDNAGGSQCLKTVADRISHYLLNTNVQLGASYGVSQEAAKKVQEGVEAMRLFFNAADHSEIVCGSSSTVVVANFARAIGPTCKPGQEIIVTDADHESNISPWKKIAKEHGLVVKVWKVDVASQQLQLSDLEKLLSNNTRLVTFTQCSNIFGTIHDVKAIAAAVHKYPSAEVFVDGVAYGPHRVIDLQDWDIDYYVLSMYKIYGPHISAGYAKRKCLEAMASINHDSVLPTEIPYKIQPGRASYELVAALPAIVEYVGTLPSNGAEKLKFNEVTREHLVKGFELITQQEVALVEPLLQYLLSQKGRGVRLLGSEESKGDRRVPTVSFVVEGLKSQDIVLEMDKAKIGVRFGAFYSNKLVSDALGLDKYGGVVRISFVHYNTLEEVKRCVGALDSTLTNLLAAK